MSNGLNNIVFVKEIPDYKHVGTLCTPDMVANRKAEMMMKQTIASLSKKPDTFILNKALGEENLKAYIRVSDEGTHMQVQKNGRVGLLALEESLDKLLKGEEKAGKALKQWAKFLCHPFEGSRGITNLKNGESIITKAQRAMQSLNVPAYKSISAGINILKKRI